MSPLSWVCGLAVLFFLDEAPGSGWESWVGYWPLLSFGEVCDSKGFFSGIWIFFIFNLDLLFTHFYHCLLYPGPAASISVIFRNQIKTIPMDRADIACYENMKHILWLKIFFHSKNIFYVQEFFWDKVLFSGKVFLFHVLLSTKETPQLFFWKGIF